MQRDVWSLAIGLFLAIVIGLTPASAQEANSETKAESTQPEATVPLVFSKKAPETLADLREMEAHLKSLASQVGPAVVGVQIGRAQGSGVIVSKDGYVLTAGHVSGAPGARARVILQSGEVVEGRTLGRVRAADAGMIRISGDRTDWPHMTMANAGSVERGEWCLTLGHPGGFNKERPAPLRFGRVLALSANTIHTDCELVGGDSGGPVFDMEGRVIGINSRIGPQTAMNYHVAIDVFHEHWKPMSAAEDLKGHSGAFLGISGTKEAAGLKIATIHKRSPAERAGLRVGDVLVTFEGKKVGDIDSLIELVGDEPPGSRVKVQILRNGKPQDIELTLSDLPD